MKQNHKYATYIIYIDVNAQTHCERVGTSYPGSQTLRFKIFTIFYVIGVLF